MLKKSWETRDRTVSDEVRKKISLGCKGKPKYKLKGQAHSEEHRKNLSIASRKRWDRYKLNKKMEV